MKTLIVTIGASPTQVTTQNLYASLLILQANTAAATLGTSSTTSSSTGISLSTTTALVIPSYIPRGVPLNSLWIAGTQSDTVTVLYEPSA